MKTNLAKNGKCDTMWYIRFNFKTKYITYIRFSLFDLIAKISNYLCLSLSHTHTRFLDLFSYYCKQLLTGELSQTPGHLLFTAVQTAVARFKAYRLFKQSQRHDGG